MTGPSESDLWLVLHQFRLRGGRSLCVQTEAPDVGGSLVWPQAAIENSLVQEDAG